MNRPHVKSEAVDRVLDREAPEHEEDAVLDHLAACRECAERFGPRFEVALLAAIPSKTGALRRTVFARLAAAAVLVGTTLTLSLSVDRTHVPPRPPPARVFEVHRLVLTRTERRGALRVEETWKRVNDSTFAVTRERIDRDARVVETWSVRSGES